MRWKCWCWFGYKNKLLQISFQYNKKTKNILVKKLNVFECVNRILAKRIPSSFFICFSFHLHFFTFFVTHVLKTRGHLLKEEVEQLQLPNYSSSFQKLILLFHLILILRNKIKWTGSDWSIWASHDPPKTYISHFTHGGQDDIN